MRRDGDFMLWTFNTVPWNAIATEPNIISPKTVTSEFGLKYCNKQNFVIKEVQ